MRRILPFVLLAILFAGCPVEIIKNTTWKGSGEYQRNSVLYKMDIDPVQFNGDGSMSIRFKYTSGDGQTFQSGDIQEFSGVYQLDNDGNLNADLDWTKTIYAVGQTSQPSSTYKIKLSLSGKLDLLTNTGSGSLKLTFITTLRGGELREEVTGSWNFARVTGAE